MEIIAVLSDGILEFYTIKGRRIKVNVFDYDAAEGMSEEFISTYDGDKVRAYTTGGTPLKTEEFIKMTDHIKKIEQPNAQYRNIVFIQGSEAVPYIELLNEKGSLACIDELFEFDYGEGEITDYEPWGKADDVWEWTNAEGQTYVLSCNQDLDYISLTEVIKN